MDDQKTVVVIPENMTEEETALLNSFKKNGCPGLVGVKPEKIEIWHSLYMAGKTYTEIVNICCDKKELILYVSDNQNWFEKRMTKFRDIDRNLYQKTQLSVKESINTITSMISSWNKYYDRQFTKYLQTNDESLLKSIDDKQIRSYLKTLETLMKIVNPPVSNNKNSGVNININTPTKIEEGDSEDNSLDIDTLDALEETMSHGETLKTLLKLKSDIKNNKK